MGRYYRLSKKITDDMAEEILKEIQELQDVEKAEFVEEKTKIIQHARPVHIYSIYYSEPGSNKSTALSALYDFNAQLQEEPTLAEACQSEAWAIYAAGDYWYLSWPGGRLKTNPAEVEAEILENFEP